MRETLPKWLMALDAEDEHFLRRFLLASGSLKAMAQEYGVSYPTVRSRLNKLIGKVKALEEPESDDPFHRELKLMVAEGALTAKAARVLLKKHQETMREGEKSE